ncbi:alpha-1,2-fucosyltransferase [Telluribacter sp. SYSU D00476]|uniref:alpha-1,2-fucosyltransferase n=1 Tax=Telluribacter sp. SYSU D00476 TaxID=2811430 RepID=UPI001FF22EB5|nr:alpha-1,2-fucosyltransferase [Telluribacter sp. SYSU D00476]
MITIKLKGGLGNQLFQYATARALAVKHQTRVAFDLSFLLKREADAPHTFREYELAALTIPPVEPSLIEKLAFGLMDIPARKLLQRIVRRVIAGKVYNEKSFSYDPAIESRTAARTYLNGYFPSERYFKSIEPLLRTELRFIGQPDASVVHRIRNSCSVSMHVRRGDYLTNPSARQYHGLCSPDYYRRAVAYLASKRPDIHIFVFSDDLPWARQHISFPHPIDFVEGNLGANSYLDMQLMSMCQHHIIANSSFSWWGAWLNPSPDKIVIAPKRWFADETAQSQTQDIVPDSWIRL